MDPRTPEGQRLLDEVVSVEGDWLRDGMADSLAKVEAEAAAAERPTQDDVDRIAARISATGYASDAVEVFEDWTRERWGMESTFTTRYRAEMAVPCELCGCPVEGHRSMSQSRAGGGWDKWEWCASCDKHPEPPPMARLLLADPDDDAHEGG